ncbi:MAG: hypothetical protein AAFV43_00580 [Planctomycetota bacterium]
MLKNLATIAVLLSCAAGAHAERVEVRLQGVADSVWYQDAAGDYVQLTQQATAQGFYAFETSSPTTLSALSPGTSAILTEGVELQLDLALLPSSLPGVVALRFNSATLGYTNTLGDSFFDAIAPIDERVLTNILPALDEATQQLVLGHWAVQVLHTSPTPPEGDFRILSSPVGHERLTISVVWWDPNRVNLALPGFAAEFEATAVRVMPEPATAWLAAVLLSGLAGRRHTRV